ncbi:MAG: hypothetical protein MJ010_07605 [Paludibacteraceae bacterium]|nr:hypothetical protein [Paludibacteraceae bacterium]
MENIDDILKKNKAKEEPYKVPEGYFEDFQARLNAKIDAIEAKKTQTMDNRNTDSASKKSALWIKIKPLLYVAASIIALYGITYVVVQPKINSEVEAQMAAIEADEAEEEQIDDFYQYFAEYGDMESAEFYEYISYNY